MLILTSLNPSIYLYIIRKLHANFQHRKICIVHILESNSQVLLSVFFTTQCFVIVKFSLLRSLIWLRSGSGGRVRPSLVTTLLSKAHRQAILCSGMILWSCYVFLPSYCDNIYCIVTYHQVWFHSSHFLYCHKVVLSGEGVASGLILI